MRGVCALNFEAMSVIQGPQINMDDLMNVPNTNQTNQSGIFSVDAESI